MVIPCLPKGKHTRQQEALSDDELHAFDLTWRNYLPSVSQFCCCLQSRGGAIRLDDEDPLIEPAYYNDHTLYRGEALQNYLDNPRDWEFESVLGQNDLPHFVTRNPFGTATSMKKKKKKSKKSKTNKRERPVVMETDMEEGDIIGYDIDDHQEDAEYLGDDQIANLAYNRHSSQVMDQYGEELYYQHMQGPVIQEMQAPPREFYAAKTMPLIHFEQENDEDYEERVIATTSTSHLIKPQASIEAAQTLLNGKLDDLTEKLSFIKNNIININSTPADDSDTTTLHTLNHQETRLEQNSVCSDIDSITSAALDVYENTTVAFENQQQHQNQYQQRRYSNSDELHLPSLTDNTPFVSDQHPFTYFNNHSAHDEEEEGPEEETNDNTNNVRNMVYGFSKKWLGV